MRLSAIIAIIAAALILLLAATYVKSTEEPRGRGGIFVERNIKYEGIEKI